MTRPPSLFSFSQCLLFASLMALSACGYVHDPNAYFSGSWEEEYTRISDCALSGDHSGNHVTVWVNDLTDPDELERPFAEGTVLLKAQYDGAGCSDLAGFTVMRKGAPGTAPETGDWEWQFVDDVGEITGQGQMSSCINCHTAAAADDYVFSTAVD